MNQGPFYESGTMAASMTKSEEEAQEPEKRVSNWVSQVSGSKEQSVWQKQGWAEELPRTEIKSSRPNSTTDAKQGKQLQLRNSYNPVKPGCETSCSGCVGHLTTHQEHKPVPIWLELVGLQPPWDSDIGPEGAWRGGRRLAGGWVGLEWNWETTLFTSTSAWDHRAKQL